MLTLSDLFFPSFEIHRTHYVTLAMFQVSYYTISSKSFVVLINFLFPRGSRHENCSNFAKTASIFKNDLRVDCSFSCPYYLLVVICLWYNVVHLLRKCCKETKMFFTYRYTSPPDKLDQEHSSQRRNTVRLSTARRRALQSWESSTLLSDTCRSSYWLQ